MMGNVLMFFVRVAAASMVNQATFLYLPEANSFVLR
jgi:hypothetical protein